ncbi:PREDICTED: ubiquitin carboxyl-terminal hydrolase 2-like [Rhagoletis zephyria]|uniref:ubiquitin carboxyl-terminal hydrolase 2-like n=1 Tax=Rhagoletis zephyria TaxID=28612 RepID=UPI0008117DAD|nr:PREDICTED: ubiquitin carboxyl-terminal hydrolase 2-like [Rhagoletis zephyria]
MGTSECQRLLVTTVMCIPIAFSSRTREPLETKTPVAGLTNLGNTCYMNSVLQALYATKELRDFVIGCFESGGQLYTGKSKDTTDKSQQDAQEFLRYLINGLHDEVNKAKCRLVKRQLVEPKSSQEAWNLYRDRIDDSKLIELFVGQFSSVIKCTDCHNESTCWDPFWDLSLAVPRYRSRVDIEECLAAFTEQETLDGNEQPFCSNCKKHRRSTKRLSIVRSPKILIIHLKKFSNDGYKLSSDITVNQTITIESRQYEVHAAICHHGFSAKSGHYTAYCHYDGKWFHMNDEKVKDVTDSFSMATLKDAYVLFYRQKDSSYFSSSSGSGSTPSSLSSKYSSRL